MLNDVEFSFYKARKSLEKLSKEHQHGWGIAWFDGVSWHLYKEPRPLYMS